MSSSSHHHHITAQFLSNSACVFVVLVGMRTTKPYAHKNKNPEMPLFRIKQQIPQQNSSLLDKVADSHYKTANNARKVANICNFAKKLKMCKFCSLRCSIDNLRCSINSLRCSIDIILQILHLCIFSPQSAILATSRDEETKPHTVTDQRGECTCQQAPN